MHVLQDLQAIDPGQQQTDVIGYPGHTHKITESPGRYTVGEYSMHVATRLQQKLKLHKAL